MKSNKHILSHASRIEAQIPVRSSHYDDPRSTSLQWSSSIPAGWPVIFIMKVITWITITVELSFFLMRSLSDRHLCRCATVKQQRRPDNLSMPRICPMTLRSTITESSGKLWRMVTETTSPRPQYNAEGPYFGVALQHVEYWTLWPHFLGEWTFVPSSRSRWFSAVRRCSLSPI